MTAPAKATTPNAQAGPDPELAATDKLNSQHLSAMKKRQGVANEMDSYVPVQLAARYRADDTLTLYARMENLLGEEYELANGYNTPGKGLYGGVRIDF